MKNKESSFKIAAFSFLGIILFFMFALLNTCRGQVTTSRAYWSNDTTLVVIAAVYHEFNINHKVIDTITAIRTVDVQDKFVSGHIDGETVIMEFQGLGWIQFRSDNVYSSQSTYRFETTKEFGKLIYKELEAPFQFVDVWFDDKTSSDIKFNAVINRKQTHIISYIDGKKFKEFTPGHSYKDEDGNYRFEFRVDGSPGTWYAFSCEITDENGNIDVYNIALKW